jgi:hypothetical protein
MITRAGQDGHFAAAAIDADARAIRDVRVASRVPTMPGMPYSRATIAA